MLPEGAYIQLASLQQLRHLAKQCVSAKLGKSKALLGGHHQSRAISRGMEFEEVRPYQAGDDIRSIDWRVTARTQVTHSKRYAEEKEKPIVTAVDQRRSSFFGSHPCFKSVYSCHLAALINWATLDKGDRSGGMVLGSQKIEETRPARSHKTVNRWLQQLCNANQQLSAAPNIEPTLSELLERIIHSTQTGTSVYIISDYYDLDEHCEKLLFQIARHHQVTLLWVVDQLEMSLPNVPQLSISNGQSTTPMPLHQKAKQAFEQQFVAKQERLTQLCQRLRIRLVKAPVQTPPMDIVNGLL
ncbi:MAG: hypothetical protein ACI9NY_001438 [Kiritimatiellia bacterium]|jgi:uncharacterized protein (DUF58 family)